MRLPLFLVLACALGVTSLSAQDSPDEAKEETPPVIVIEGPASPDGAFDRTFGTASVDAAEKQSVDATFGSEAELAIFGAPAATVPEIIPTSDFAKRGALGKLRMSPDGTRFALVRYKGRTSRIQVVAAESFEVLDELSFNERHLIEWLEWAGNDRLIYAKSTRALPYGREIRLSRMFLRDLDKKTVYEFESRDKLWDIREALHIEDDGSSVVVALQEKPDLYPSVYRYELKPQGALTRIAKPIKGVTSWYADTRGIVRAGTGYYKKKFVVHYRRTAADPFKLLAKLKDGADRQKYWDIARIIGDSDEGYILQRGESGRVGVRLFDFVKGEVLDTYYEHPRWDVERLWVGDDGEPIAAFYTANREEVVWFDREYASVHQRLDERLEFEEVVVVSRSEDREKMLVWTGNEANPGEVYFYNSTTDELRAFDRYRPSLDPEKLARPFPIRIKTRDDLTMFGYLTLPRAREPKNLPLILLPHGGPFGVRDTLTYSDEVQFLANRGYAVLQPNFRGSGGFGEEFYEAGRGEIGRRMQDDLDDAMDWAVEKGIADPEKVCVIGGSYGGYAAMWAVLRNPERYVCAASWAGVTDLPTLLEYDANFLSRRSAKEWKQRMQGDKDFDLASVSPMSKAKDLSRPLLLMHGTKDWIVPFFQYQMFEEASNSAPVRPTKRMIAKEGHGFSSASSEQQWYDALDYFLARHNPADQLDERGELRKAEPEAAE